MHEESEMSFSFLHGHFVFLLLQIKYWHLLGQPWCSGFPYSLHPFLQPLCQAHSFCQKWCFLVFYSRPESCLGPLVVWGPKFPISFGYIIWCTINSSNVFNAHMHPLKLHKEQESKHQAKPLKTAKQISIFCKWKYSQEA